MKIIGIESTCDNSALCFLSNKTFILSFNLNQDQSMSEYGGYVPVVLSNNHFFAFRKIFLSIKPIINGMDVIAVSTGPGMIMSICIGYKFAITLSHIFKKKIFFVDHIEAHILSPRISFNIDFPFVSFVISGGHCLLVIVEGVGSYKLLAQTVDDAPGEVFDKVARELKVNIINGQQLEKLARSGNIIQNIIVKTVQFKNKRLNYSFSGLKSHYLRVIQSKLFKPEDIAATFQHNMALYMVKVITNIYSNLEINYPICLVGGVGANKHIQTQFISEFSNNNIRCYFLPNKYAGDNAEMIAWCCREYLLINNKLEKTSMCPQKLPYHLLDYSKFI